MLTVEAGKTDPLEKAASRSPRSDEPRTEDNIRGRKPEKSGKAPRSLIPSLFSFSSSVFLRRFAIKRYTPTPVEQAEPLYTPSMKTVERKRNDPEAATEKAKLARHLRDVGPRALPICFSAFDRERSISRDRSKNRQGAFRRCNSPSCARVRSILYMNLKKKGVRVCRKETGLSGEREA